MPSSFDLNDKQNSNAEERSTKQRPGSFPVPAVPRDVKVSCNRPKHPEAICWKDPTFFEPTQKKSTPDSMTNQTDDSTTIHPSDIQDLSVSESSDDTSSPSSTMDSSHSSVNESSDGAFCPSADKSSGNTSSPPGDRDSSIRYVDDIIIESGERIPWDEKSKSQIATQITTIRAIETPISESIYAPPKFETNVNTSRLGKKAAWASSHQHSFLGLRYTTYEPSSKTFRRKRAVMGLCTDGTFTDLNNDIDSHQSIGTQSDISYDKLIDVMKSIPKYFSDRPKFKEMSPRFKKTNNCNLFVHSMAEKAGLKDIAELHHTISPGDAANNILNYMSQDGSDLSRVRVEFDGTKSKLMRRPVFVQEEGVVSLGLNEDEFLTEARQIMKKDGSKSPQDPSILSSLNTINSLITKMIEIIKPLLWLDNKDDRVAHVQALFPLLTMIDSNILETVKLASGNHKMLQVYLMGILDFFHTVRNELLGLSSYSSSSESSSSESSSSESSSSESSSSESSSSESSSSEFLASEQEDALDSETPHSFEHRPSAQTAFYFKNLSNDASLKNYTKDILKLTNESIVYNDNLSELIRDKNEERFYKAGYDEFSSPYLAEQMLKQQHIERMNRDRKIQISFLNNIILGKYESDFTTLMKSLKNRNPEQPIDATDTYYKILKLYQAALNDSQNQKSLANYMDLYQSIPPAISMQRAIYGIVDELQYHLYLTLLSAGVTSQHELQIMFSNEASYKFEKIRDDYLHKDLDTVKADVQNELDTRELAEGGAEWFNRQSKYISLLARNAKTIFYSMIYHAVYRIIEDNADEYD